jgi:hypothetical protein
MWDTIGDALSGKTSQPDGGPSNTQTTKITPRDIAITQSRRNSPEFQAALRARDQQNNAGAFAFHPPGAPQAFQPPAPASTPELRDGGGDQ